MQTHDEAGTQDSARFRERRLKYAIGTSLGSKISTAIIQILAFPIAIRALGEAQFVLYAMLGSAIGWIGLINVGVGPPLTIRMSDAQAAGDRRRQQQLLSSAFFPVLVVVTATSLALAVTSQFVVPTALFGARYAPHEDAIMVGLWMLAVMLLSQTLLSVVEAAQLGHQEQHHFNVMAIAGNLTSAAAIVLVAVFAPTVVGMVAAVGLPPLCFRIVNAVWFMRGRPHLRPTLGSVSWDLCRAILSTGLVFSLASGVGNFLCHQLPIVLMGKWLPVSDASSFAVTLNAVVLGAGMVSSVATPLWPAISDGMARGDRAWVTRAYRHIVAYALGYGALLGVIFATFGGVLFRLWYGPSVEVRPPLAAALGLYFVLLMWENAHFAVLVGINRIGLPSILYLCRSVAAVALMSLLVPHVGSAAAFMALSVSVLVLTLLPLWYLVRRALTGPHGA